MNKEIEYGNYFYFTIPKGRVILIKNPHWNNDEPSTHFHCDLCLSEDVLVCTDSRKYKGTLLKKYLGIHTDYPFVELGNIPQKQAPIREVALLSYDQDKYVTVKYGGIIKEIKGSYIYSNIFDILDKIPLNLAHTYTEKGNRSE